MAPSLLKRLLFGLKVKGKKTKRNFINCYVFECKQIIKVDSIASGQIEDGLTVRSLNNLLQLS